MSARGAPTEKAEQSWGVQLLRTLGAGVWVTGVPRKRGDFQGAMRTAGLPDVLAFLPPPPTRGRKNGGDWRGRFLLFWECKRAGGQLRPAQADFKRLTDQVPGAVAHLVGPYDALLAWLAARGYVKAENIPSERRAPPQLEGD